MMYYLSLGWFVIFLWAAWLVIFGHWLWKFRGNSRTWNMTFKEEMQWYLDYWKGKFNDKLSH